MRTHSYNPTVVNLAVPIEIRSVFSARRLPNDKLRCEPFLLCGDGLTLPYIVHTAGSAAFQLSVLVTPSVLFEGSFFLFCRNGLLAMQGAIQTDNQNKQ